MPTSEVIAYCISIEPDMDDLSVGADVSGRCTTTTTTCCTTSCGSGGQRSQMQ